MAKNPYEALGIDMWRKGMLLGILLIGLFVLGAILVGGLALLLGTSLGNSILLGLIAGPFIGTAFFALYWIVKKPAIFEGKPKN